MSFNFRRNGSTGTSFCDHYILQKHVSLVFSAIAVCNVLHDIVLNTALSHYSSCFKLRCQYGLNFSKVILQTHSVHEISKHLLAREPSTEFLVPFYKRSLASLLRRGSEKGVLH